MSKTLVLMIILVFLIASCIIVANPVSGTVITENSWVPKAPMHEPRSSLGVAVVNNKIYAIGGSSERGIQPNPIISGGITSDTNEEYDPATDKWIIKASMPTPRNSFAIASFQNKIYCIGGKTSDGHYTGVNEVYDPSTDIWENKTSMPIARGGLQANVVNGKVYLIGGYPNETLNEVYDPATDTWSTKKSMPTGVYGGASAVIDNKIYVIAGSLNQIYDTESDKWTTGASSPSYVYGWSGGATGAATTGAYAPKRIYVMSAASTSNQLYDPKTDTWTLGAETSIKRAHTGIAIVNDTLYVIGGVTYYFTYPDDANGVIATEYATNDQYIPVGYGMPYPSYVPLTETTPPKISLLSPLNLTYNESIVSLVFVEDKMVNWTGYSVDGKNNVTFTGNITLTGLSKGLHNITVYAKDTFGNTEASEAVFNIYYDPFPTAPVVAVSGVTVVVVLALIINYRKRNQSHNFRA